MGGWVIGNAIPKAHWLSEHSGVADITQRRPKFETVLKLVGWLCYLFSLCADTSQTRLELENHYGYRVARRFRAFRVQGCKKV